MKKTTITFSVATLAKLIFQGEMAINNEASNPIMCTVLSLKPLKFSNFTLKKNTIITVIEPKNAAANLVENSFNPNSAITGIEK